jgi:acetamidase/formamidase
MEHTLSAAPTHSCWNRALAARLSVAMKLRLSQVVNEPMITVSAALAKSVLPVRTLF